MKKSILTFLFIIMTVSVIAQLNLQMGLGASTQKYATVELSAGYDLGSAFIQTGYIASITRNVDGGVYINGCIGRKLTFSDNFFAEPAIGYAYILRTTDRKELNGQGMMYSAGVGKDINDGSIVLKAIYCERAAFITFGIRYNF